MHSTHNLLSELLSTRSIVSPLGRLGIDGKGATCFLVEVCGGELGLELVVFVGGEGSLSAFDLFFADCLVLGGDILEDK